MLLLIKVLGSNEQHVQNSRDRVGFGEYQNHIHASMAALRGQVVTT